MRVLGLDVGRNTCVGVLLSEFPSNPVQYFKTIRNEFVRLNADRDGVNKLLELKPDVIVLEPTGSWYSAFWADAAKCYSIEVAWIGHADLAHQRGSYGFKNKRDDEDAFCLALTYFDERFVDRLGNKRFLRFEPQVLKLRRKFLDIEMLDKHRTMGINQLRQRLCHEFPEAAEQRILPNDKTGVSPFLLWLAEEDTYKRVEKKYADSIAREVGITLQTFTRNHARRLVQVERETQEIREEILELLNTDEFYPYLQVFKRFGFGFTNQLLLLSQIYPFSKFLVDGKPWVEYELPPIGRYGRGDGKAQKRNRSLRQFQAYLGLSFKLKQSGDKLSKSFLGSTMVRSHLYIWAVGKIRTRPASFAVDTAIGELLSDKVAELTAKGVEGSDKVTRVVFRATALLYKELVKTFC